MNPIPFIDLNRETDRVRKAYLEDVQQLLLNCSFIGGETVSKFESTFQQRFGVPHLVGVANGTDALTLALRAADVRAGDEVLCSSFTFVATVESICNLGAKPVFVDIDPETLQTNLAEIQNAWRKNLKTAQIAWIFGWAPQDLPTIRKFFAEQSVSLIEDWAQGVGTKFQGMHVLSQAWMSTVSFYPTKVLGAFGDGGGVGCSTRELADQIRVLANHGRDTRYTHSEWGYNSRLDTFQAAALTRKLELFDETLKARCDVAAWYRRNLEHPSLRIPKPGPGVEENGYLFPVLCEARDKLQCHLRDKEIGTMVVYPLPIHQQTAALKYLEDQPSLPGAEQTCREVLCLPLFAGMTSGELERVAEAVRSFSP